MKTYCSDCKHGRLDMDEPPCCDCDHTLWEPKQPQPAPEPELMSGADAISKAARDGGQVFNALADSFRVSYDSNGCVIENSGCFIDLYNKEYTVRPLPDPYPLSFAEAWEALGRGESVAMQDNEVAVVIEPYLKCKAANSGAYVSITSMPVKKFRIVEERSKA